MHTQTLLCFGARPGAGNPALVIEDTPSNTAGRPALARARDTTCVFIDPGDDGVPLLDFWYPHTRSPLCLHATLAAAAVLFARRPDAATIVVRTAMHGQRLELVRAVAPDAAGTDASVHFARLRLDPALHVAPAPDVAASLLRIPVAALATPPRVASVGSPKLLVELRDAAALHDLVPDLAGIAAWGRDHAVNGIYAWCRSGAGDYEGRNFNHLDPALEDSATGVAAGALTALLGHGLRLRQGRATGRDCLIRTGIEDDGILVGGRVEFA